MKNYFMRRKNCNLRLNSKMLTGLSVILFLLCMAGNGLCLSAFMFFPEAFSESYAAELGADEQELRGYLGTYLYYSGLRIFLVIGLPAQIIALMVVVLCNRLQR